MNKKVMVAILIIILASGGCDWQGVGKKPTLRIGHISITDHLTLGVSQKRDGESFKNFKLKPVKFKGWPELKQELIAGSLDGAFILAPLGMKTATEMHDKGEHIHTVLLGHRDGSALMIRVGSDINTASDFQGKIIAIPDVYSIHNILLHKIVTKAGLDYEKDITVKVMAPPDMPFALIAEEIDAYIVAEPFCAQVEEYEYGKIFTLSRGIWVHHICCVLVIRDAIIEKDPEAVQELVDSLVKSGEFIEQNPEEASVMGGRFLEQSKKTIYRVLTVPDDRVCYDHLLPDKQDFEDVQNYLVDVMGVTDKKIGIDHWVITEFAEKAFEKIGGQKPMKYGERRTE